MDEEIYVELALKSDIDGSNDNDNDEGENKENNDNNSNTSIPSDCGKVEILAPNFYIAPYNDIWEYEEPELISSKSRSQSSSNTNAKSDIGIYEKRGNYTSIIVEITPLCEVEEFKVCSFTLFYLFDLYFTYSIYSTYSIFIKVDNNIDIF